MDNKEFGRVLERRTREFAVRIIKFSGSLPDTPEGKVVRNQLTKAGTSIGANYREANRARSKADFRNKIKICESESSETIYWLEIIGLLDWVKKSDTDVLLKEATEYLALFTSIGGNLSHKPNLST